MDETKEENKTIDKNSSKIGQNQIQDLLFNKEIGWQEIIYDLINTEQLDPWDVDIVILTDKYLEKIKELEEADFFISSKVLLAASLLLRIKSEILLNKYIRSIDDILFGRKEEQKKKEFERINLEEDIPELIPRSPMPRFRKVTLKELLESLNKAIVTENRRIKKEILNRGALIESSISIPKKTINIKDRIKDIFNRINNYFSQNKEHKKISYSVFTGENQERKIDFFSPLIYLENQNKIWLEQKEHFGEVYIWMKSVYFKNNGDPYFDLREKLNEFSEGVFKEDFISEEDFEKFAEKDSD